MPGDYVVKVHFYSGSSTSNVKITIKAGPHFMTKEFSFNPRDWYYAGTIRVTAISGTNMYNFEIIWNLETNDHLSPFNLL